MRIAITGFLRDGSHGGHFAYRKYVGELLPGRKEAIKKSKLLLNMNKLKNFLQKKVYEQKFYNENYSLSFKKTYALFFLIWGFLWL